MNNQMKIVKEVSIKADLFPDRTKPLGEIAAKAFSDKHKAQLKGLENIANSALKVSDVLNYIKRQTGKSETGKKWKQDKFGEKLLKEIEGMKKSRDQICQSLKTASDEQKLEVYLRLIREFVRQVVIYYEFFIGK